jgi:exoribonuclease R
MNRIFGILYLDDKRTDIDKKGNKIKKFKPIFPYKIDKTNKTNKIDKEILIKTKRSEMHRTYCVVNLNDLSVNEYISIEFLNEELFQKMATCNWSMKINTNYSKKFNMLDLTPNRIMYDANIISIDPYGCVDIDDAISIIHTEYIELGIHIADPTSIIDLNSDLGKELTNRIESVYLEKTNHMIPENIGNLISLKKGELKNSYSLIIKFNTKDITQIENLIKTNSYSYEFIKTKIIVKENMSYEEFEKKLDNTYYKEIYDIGYNICKALNLNVVEYDSHKMVEGYMILCNHISSNHTFINRINKKKFRDIEYIFKNNKLNNIYDNCLQESAEYVLNDSEQIHEGIGLKYTHFTSPMRRYVDFLNHYIIYNNCKYDEIQQFIDLDKINYIHKYYKKIYNIRNINKLLDSNDHIKKQGIITFIELNKIRILIDDLLITVNIFDKKLLEHKIINIIKQDSIQIEFEYKENKIKYCLGQSIDIEIYKNKLETNSFRFIIDSFTFF